MFSESSKIPLSTTQVEEVDHARYGREKEPQEQFLDSKNVNYGVKFGQGHGERFSHHRLQRELQ